MLLLNTLKYAKKNYGEPVELNGFEYTVNSIVVLKTDEFSEKYDLSMEEVQKNYDDSYKIFIADLDIKNIGESEIMPGLENIFIQCFGYSNSYSYSMVYEINSHLIETIKPNEKIKAQIPFAVSEKSFKNIDSQQFFIAFYDDYVKYEIKAGEYND